MLAAVWLLDLAVGSDEQARLAGLLDAEERLRAERFRHECDRRRFIVRRGLLRALLAEQTGRAPGSLRLTGGRFAKPSLVGRNDIRFSLSHSHDIGLCAVASDGEIGCDIERRNRLIDPLAVAQRLFAPAERDELRRVPPERRHEAFFNGWSRKEAYVKALGLGLSCPLDSFEVSLSPDVPVVLRVAGGGWSLQAFEPAPDYHAAVAIEGEARAVSAPRWFEPCRAAACA